MEREAKITLKKIKRYLKRIQVANIVNLVKNFIPDVGLAPLIMNLIPRGTAGLVFAHLSMEAIEQLVFGMARYNEVKEVDVINLWNAIQEHSGVQTANMSEITDMLSESIGNEIAHQVLDNLTSPLVVKPFASIQKFEADTIFDLIKNESMQCQALVVIHLDRNLADLVLRQFPETVRQEILGRLEKMEAVSPDVCREVERVLERLASRPPDFPDAKKFLEEIKNVV